MSNLQTYYHFKLDFQKVDRHTGGKWLIHGTKRRKDNQLQSLDTIVKTHGHEIIPTNRLKLIKTSMDGLPHMLYY